MTIIKPHALAATPIIAPHHHDEPAIRETSRPRGDAGMSRRLILGGALSLAGGLLGCARSGADPIRDGSTGSGFTPQGCSHPSNSYGGRTPRIAPATASSGSPDARPQSPLPTQCYATADNIEGPFFMAGAPERASLVSPQTRGKRLTIAGRVLSTDCRVVPGAQIEFWQADHTGAYDNRGYGFRAMLHSGPGGDYRLDTIVPGHYLNGARYRPAHIHVKLRAPGLRPLTTQLYLPDDPYNDGDPFIVSSLIMSTRAQAGGTWASFDFVLPPM